MRTMEPNAFPYTMSTVCFIFVANNGETKQIGADMNKREAYTLAKAGIGKIIAVYPGKYRSDAFYIDTEEFGVTFGFAADSAISVVGVHKGDSTLDTKMSKCWDIEVKTKDDVCVHSIPNFLERLEKELNKTCVCELAKSRGFGSHTVDGVTIVSVFARQMIPFAH